MDGVSHLHKPERKSNHSCSEELNWHVFSDDSESDRCCCGKYWLEYNPAGPRGPGAIVVGEKPRSSKDIPPMPGRDERDVARTP